jgi:hypothetical protein
MTSPLTVRPDPSEYAPYAVEYVSHVREGNVLDMLASQIDDLMSELKNLRSATLHLYRNLDDEALMRRGIANGIETSVRALAFITAGHEHHHLEVLRARYLS